MDAPPGRSPARSAVTITLCVLLLGGFGLLTVRYVAVDLPTEIANRARQGAKETAREVAEQIASAFQVQPKVVVGHTTVVEQRSEVLQLTTLEETITERQRTDESWLLSTKTLEVEADFVVRVGFDLTKPFVVTVDEFTGGLRVTLPPPQILSTEVRDVRFLRDENGLWNPLSSDDRERALRDLRQRVAKRVQSGALLAEARVNAEKRLTALLARDGRPVEFAPAPSPSPRP